MKKRTLLVTLTISVVLLGACVSPPAPAPSPAPPVTTNIARAPSTALPTEATTLTPKPTPTPTSVPIPTTAPPPSASPEPDPLKITPPPTPTRAPRPAFTPPPTPYAGSLFDTHLHLYVTSTNPQTQLERVISYLDRSKVAQAIGFYSLPPDKSTFKTWASESDKIAKGVARGIIPLLMPVEPQVPFAAGQYNEASLRQYFKPQGPVVGLGELLLKNPELQSITFDSPVMQTLFTLVNELKLIVMIHLRDSGRTIEIAEVEPAVRQYPDAIFLFHGQGDFDTVVAPLMDKYPNVYYTMDAVNWWWNLRGEDNLINPPWNGPNNTAASFLERVSRIGVERLVTQTVLRMAPRLQQYPDRIFWGTDLSRPWHFEQSVSDMVIKISREIIGGLPVDLQEKYAYKNALNVFGRFLTPKP